jgi:putative acetyltransferase
VHDGAVTRIRPEQPADVPGTRAVNLAAFETSTEADLVDVLRKRADPIVSLVADAGHAIVGHILFSPATLPGYPGLRIMGLAPMAVAPARQRQGIGAALIYEGFEQCRRLGVGAIIVLGHAGYYPALVSGRRHSSACGPNTRCPTTSSWRWSWFKAA